MKKALEFAYKHHYIAFGTFCIVLGLCTGLFWNYKSKGLGLSAIAANAVLVLVCIGAMIFLKIKNRLSEKKIITLIFIAGSLFRLAYIFSVSATTHQHDVEGFGSGLGHAGYIEYLLYNHMLPDFDPTSVWQFYHPPMHHIICAVWMRLQILCGISYASAMEGLQFLTFFYSGVCCIACIKIFKLAGMKNFSLYIASLFVCVNPTFRFFSGSINNDCLSAMFIFLTVYFTIKWYDNKKIKTILPIAICLGLGMITKLSSGLVAVGVACVFLYSFFKEQKKTPLIGQYAAFGAVCAPIGLSWTLRNIIMFNTPVNYVPDLGSDNYQYIGDHSVFQRLFDFSPYQFSSPFIAWGEHSGDTYYEFNPTVGYLKTACFEEYFSSLRILPFIFLISFCLCVVFSICGLILLMLDIKNTRGKLAYAFVFICTAVYFISYYVFCLKYPQVCTMNARYVSIAVLAIPMFLGYTISNARKEKSTLFKIISYAAGGSVCCLAVISVVLYFVLLI